MRMDQKKVDAATKAIEELCLNCENHSETCYIAVAKRAMATLKAKNDTSVKS